MSLVYSAAEPQPSLAWQFQSSNVDYVTGLTPSSQVSPGPAQLVGGATLVTNAPSGSNTAVSFVGTSGYMNLGTSSPANFSSLVSNTFVEFWVYTNSLTTTQIYGQGNPTTSGRNYSILHGNRFGISYDSTDLVSSITVSAQRWYHVAVSIHTSTSVSLFVDGSLVGTSATVPSTYTSYPVVIGALNGGYFNGYIRDLRVVQGGVVPVANFTPLASAPFSYASPGYVANMGTTVFTLLGQFITYVPGKYNQAIRIMNYPVGGDSNVTSCRLTYTSTIPMTSAGGSLTCWIKFLGLPQSSDRCTPFISHLSYVNIWGGNVLQTGGYGSQTYNSFTPVVGTWYHYAQVWNGSVMVVYINGAVLGTSGAGSITTPVNAYVNITAETVRPTSADYDDLRIYNTALTAAQVQSVYSSQGAPAPSRAMPLPRLAWDFNGTTTDYVSGVIPKTSTGFSYAAGKYQQAASFTNTVGSAPTNYIVYDITPISSAAFTVCCWVKTVASAGGGIAVSIRGNNPEGDVRIFLGGTSPGNLVTNYNMLTSPPSTYTGVNAISAANSVVAGVWNHVAVTIIESSVSGTVLSCFLNGSLVSTATSAYGAPRNLYGVGVGAFYSLLYNNGFNGLVDDLRIFDRSLTSSQVQSIYNQQGVPGRGVNVYSGAEPQPSLAWQFQSSNVDYVTGLTPSSQVSPGPAQLQGSAALVTNAPTSNTAVSFNGTTGYMNLGTTSPTNFDYSTSNIFFEAWIYFNDLSTIQRIYQKDAFTFRYNSGNGKLGVYGGFGGPAENDTVFTTGQWYHIAFSSVPGASSYVFVNGSPGAGLQLGYTGYNSGTSVNIGTNGYNFFNGYIRDLRVVQGGVVPTTSFTPGSAPFSYALPSYVTGSGSTVFTLLGQFVTYNPSGKYGSSLRIQNYPNGGNSNVANTYITWTSSFQSSPITGYSISLWVKILRFPYNGDSETIFQYGDSRISVFYDGSSQFALNDGTTNPSTFPSGFLSDTWVHFTGVISSSSVTGYINGVLSGTPAVNTVSRSVAGILGLGHLSTYRPMSAEIDDLRIYNTALTAAQVQSVYSSQGAPAPSRAMPLPRLAWDFNGTTTDYVSGLTGTVRLDTAGQTGGSVSYISGKYNQSLQITNAQTAPFQTGNNYVYWSIPSNLQINKATTSVSVCFWAYFNNFTASPFSQQTLLLMPGSQQTDGDLRFEILPPNLRFSILNSSGNSLTTGAPIGGWLNSVWYHICGVFVSGPGTTQLYVNGSPVGTPGNGPLASAFNLIAISLGRYPVTGGYGTMPFSGSVDDLRIYDRALTSAQVQSIYSTQGVPSRQVLSGTPLFTQLSPSARSSAVGAFSLRAVNGTSARAVQVRRVPSTAGTSAIQFSIIGNQFSRPDISATPPNTSVAGQVTYNGTTQDTQAYPLNLTPATTGMTISLNFKLNSAAASQYILKMYPTTAAQGTVQIYYNGTSLVFEGFSGSSGGYYNIGQYAATSGVNYYILMIFTGTTIYTYIDNVLWRTTTLAQSLVNDTSYRLGSLGSYGGGGYTSMTVYDFRIMNTVLTASDIVATDFYADRLGNLLTAPVTGIHLKNWLGSATGYVTTWYNQIQSGQDVSATVAANQPTIDPVNKTIVFNGSTHSFSNTSTSGGLLAACVGTGTKYTYTATWNKTGSSVARICEHEPLNTTSNQASGLSSLATTYGFSGQNNDNTLIASFTAGTQVSTVMRLNNTAAPNLRVRSNGTDYSGSTGNYATLSLNNFWFVIGRKASSNSEFFNGSMKNIMVFKDAISDTDTAVLDAWQQTL